MPESEFEKQVQEELGQLRLRPSEEVWQNVEKELRKKKRRRIVFLIFLLAGLALLSYPGYLFFKQSPNDLAHTSEEQRANAQPDKTNHSNINDIRSSEQANTSDPSTDVTNPNNSNPSVSTSIPYPGTNSTIDRVNSDKDLKDDLNKPSTGTNVSADEKKNAERISSRPVDDRSLAGVTIAGKKKTKIGVAANKPQKITATNEHAGTQQPLVIQQKPEPSMPVIASTGDGSVQKSEPVFNTTMSGADSIQKADSSIAVLAITDATVSDSISNAKKKRKTSKWEWAIDFSAGVSGSSEKALIGTASTADLMYYYYTPTAGSGAGVTGLPSQPPSVVKPGFSFHAGMIGEWKFSKRSSLVTGLQYHFKSTMIHAGSYYDTSFSFANFASQRVNVSAAYRGTPDKTYHNQYHFIQVPITYQWRVSKSEKLPLYWNIGTGLSYMVASKGLLYSNVQGGIYYYEKDAYNRFQINLNTTLYYRFGKKMSWMVGPEFNMDMSKLVKEAYGNRQYLYYGGISARYYLTPKKK